MMKQSVIGGARARLVSALLSSMTCAAMILSAAAEAADSRVPRATSQEPQSSPPRGFSSWAELAAAQEPLTRAADALSELIEARGLSGFSGITLDVPQRLVTLYWKAGQKLPLEVAHLVEQLTSREGIQIAQAEAAYSKAELRAEAERIFDEALAPGVAPGVQVYKVAPLPGWSGLSVSISGPVEEASRMAIFNQKVHLKLEQGRPLAHFSRLDDWAPYFGGARIKNSTVSCSSGFAVGNLFGQGMLTAGHCAHGNGVTFYTGVGNVMGSTTAYNKPYDTVRIAVAASGDIYDGGVGVGEFTKGVAGASRNYVGNWVCTSGSFSGARCNIMVTNVGIYWNDITTYRYGPMVEAEEQSHEFAAGPGDSGGPVFSLSSTAGMVVAKGTISAGDPGGAPASCTDSARTDCSYRIVYPDIKDLLSVHDVWIVTQ
ncbi:S1 family peptidase [Hyalangium minutum]|uniref:Putative protease B n=1 Tax=Hyalangium minutum TaxID=394096 RepID=A0A085W2S7_9BACT|nr:S1 family peptidase [Hyalangium minutum]KFE61990.1 putative protease B [Hyalangium minutum]